MSQEEQVAFWESIPDPDEDEDRYGGLPYDDVLGEDGRPLPGPTIDEVLGREG